MCRERSDQDVLRLHTTGSFGRAWETVIDTADPLLVNARGRVLTPG